MEARWRGVEVGRSRAQLCLRGCEAVVPSRVLGGLYVYGTTVSEALIEERVRAGWQWTKRDGEKTHFAEVGGKCSLRVLVGGGLFTGLTDLCRDQ